MGQLIGCHRYIDRFEKEDKIMMRQKVALPRWELTLNHWDLPIHVVKLDGSE
jgi:hypothetical protein